VVVIVVAVVEEEVEEGRGESMGEYVKYSDANYDG
jgi:hypothetical protein